MAGILDFLRFLPPHLNPLPWGEEDLGSRFLNHGCLGLNPIFGLPSDSKESQ